MADRYFTPDEVRALIPALTKLMARVTAAHRELTALGERLREEQERIAAAGGAAIDQAAWRSDRARLDALAAEIQQGLGEVAALGGVPKDLGLGLVDFLHLRDGREVNLCWKYGEPDVAYWHGLDEGYQGRKPL